MMQSLPMISRPDAPTHIRFFAVPNQSPVKWRVIDGLQPYVEMIAEMERYAEAVSQGLEPEAVWLLEHPPLFTAGTSANPADLVDKSRLPVFQTGRGGQYTYHGPGQRVVYVIMDLKRRRQDVRAFVCALEAWIINTLAEFNVKGERRSDRVGVWVTRPEKTPLPDGTIAEDKIAAVGIRLRKWVSFHGISINVEPDLSHYAGIIPCGIQDHGVTSLVDLGLPVTMEDLDIALKQAFVPVFGDIAQK